MPPLKENSLMVRLQEVPDDFDDSDLSQLSEVDDIDDSEYMDNGNSESFVERIQYLQYMLPMSWRSTFIKYTSKMYAFGKRAFVFVGGFSWVVVTSVLLIGLPIFLEYEREQSLLAYESSGPSYSNVL